MYPSDIMPPLIISGIIWGFIWGCICASIGEKKGSGCLGLFVGFLLGPVGLVIILFDRGNQIICPHCRAYIPCEASVCQKCQRDLPAQAMLPRCPYECGHIFTGRRREETAFKCPQCQQVIYQREGHLLTREQLQLWNRTHSQ